MSESFTADGVNDKSDYKVVGKALRLLGFDDALVSAIWRTLAAVLHLGNLEQTAAGRDGRIAFVDDAPLSHAAALLRIDASVLRQALTTRVVEGGGRDNVRTPLKEAEAAYAREALAKALYAGLFRSVVGVINDVIKHTSETIDLGLLDIYGFEVFESNSFEQLW